MVKEDCIYYSFQIEGAGAYSQCMNYLPGLCPCEDCNNYIPLDEIKRCIEIFKRIGKGKGL